LKSKFDKVVPAGDSLGRDHLGEKGAEIHIQQRVGLEG